MTSAVQYYFIYSLLCLCLLSFGHKVSTSSKDIPSFCGLASAHNRLVFVSTLDGKLTALNPNNNGGVMWTVQPGSESMLSSSIHKLELSNYGHLVRMIPSLDGGLYKFNGENIEIIPVTSDDLLQSSLRYSDDLVISGGRETHTFGVSLITGKIMYECSIKSCGNVSNSVDTGEILVIQKKAQIVRAVECQTGVERWNFSVAQLDLKLVSECHSVENNKENYQIKIVIPDGLVYATDAKDPNIILWKQKFNSPVIGVWHLLEGKLTQIDLFNSQVSNFHPPSSPIIYIGMFDKQLYIQESLSMLKIRLKITSKNNQNLIENEKNYPVIPWKPIPASNLIYSLAWEPQRELGNSIDDVSQRQTTALSVLYASPYVDGSGFFLYAEENSKTSSSNISEQKDQSSEKISSIHSKINENVDDEFLQANTPVEIVVVSFWYYWKEVLVISATTALICNLMITRPYLRWKFKNLSKSLRKKNTQLKYPVHKIDTVTNSNSKIDTVSKLNCEQEYVSRYLMDFEPVACLGKGGFGVVFQAKNKIDDCHYAIKRILLPRRQESRDRVLREVKALAKLDHHNIVRYFNAWTECPPTGWQENPEDFCFESNSEMFTSTEAFNQSEITHSVSPEMLSKSKCFLASSSFQPLKTNKNNFEELNLPRNDLKNEISDSFVIFNNTETNSENVMNSDNVITVDSDTDNSRNSKSTTQKSPSKLPSLELNEAIYVGSSFNKVYLYIQMQLCQRNSLKDWLMVNSERDYQYVLNVFEQILQAVEHVHLHGLIHRDLKPSNIFFSLDNQIKVGDFGLVTAMTDEDGQMTSKNSPNLSIHNEKHTAQVGTQLYMSQEQLLGKPYNYKVDIYSLGLILFELLVPFRTQMERIHVLQNIKKENFPNIFQKNYKEEYELLRLMLSNSPEERPTTYGVRARLPLKQEPVEENWHFELPVKKS